MVQTDLPPDTGEHVLYDDQWEKYEDTETVELRFIGRPRQAQQRINQFTLDVLRRQQFVDLRDADVLEFGAGHGRLATEFPYIGSYLGVERSENLVRVGQARLARSGLADRAELVAADCMTYSGPQAAFDVVCSLGMFVYVDDPSAVLRKMVSHLRPGGRLFIDVVHSSPLYNSLHQLCALTGIRKHGQRLLFSKQQIRRLFEEAGLTDVEVVMREYPLLCGLYSDWGLDWPLQARNLLARHSWLDVFGIVCFAFGTKPAAGS